MEVHSRDNEKGPVVALVLALIVIGLGSLFLTWKSIGHQRALVEHNLFLSGGSVVRSVESNLGRIVRSMRNSRNLPQVFPSLAQELFTELAASRDVAFVAMYDEKGRRIITSHQKGKTPKMDFSRTDIAVLDSGETWHFMTKFGRSDILISGLRVKRVLGELVLGQKPAFLFDPKSRMGQGMMRGRMGLDDDRVGKRGDHDGRGPKPQVYLVVGLNVDAHLSQFNQYRRAALLQTGYVFLAAVVLWSLAFAYLRRRDQGTRLVRMERFQNKLLDNMPDGLVTLDSFGVIVAANGSAKRLLNPQDGEDHDLVGREWNEFPWSGTGTSFEGQYEWQQYDYLGRQLEILSLPFQEGGEGDPHSAERLVLIRDRTRIRSLEEDLNEARRLAAIGSLAAGVAHEVRNPLSSLRGFAQLFSSKFKDQPPYGSYAETMVQEADRLDRVVTGLLYLAKPRELALESIDLDDVAATLTKLMRFDLQHGQVTPEFDFQEPELWADPDALRQVLLNLTSNSLDAIGADDSEDAEEGRISILSRRDDNGVWLCIEDNGPGMDGEVRAQAMEPFFTAKPTGTGLGLAIVDNIMRAHKGQVVIDSEPGQGTTVRLFFPDPSEDSI